MFGCVQKHEKWPALEDSSKGTVFSFYALLHAFCAPKNYHFMNKSINFGGMKLKLGQSLCLKVGVRVACLALKNER